MTALDLTRTSLDVAPRLLGAHLTVRDDRGAVTVRLTEVEAYDGGNDPGSHAYRGLTPRTEVMFGPPGRLYVYFTYGMHWCANVVCGEEGRASAVLLRGGEVVDGLELARSRRAAARRDIDLARGPARMAQALGLTGEDNGVTLSAGGRAELSGPDRPAARVQTGPRVGVAGPGGDAEAFPWRFWLTDDPTVSTYRPGVRRRRR
ncbi:DNA-3-methyladenine glycosylase [Georgenia sp. H159]|uniref:DNA-3-methyladenine glycosylase n=1 Tax=Georgenia sp. H159 TaxID=3076115 RepID=UPI002D79826B|nr:DNA-3-methyladenine glycosylase [Georgenia sp. H159]